MGSFRVGALLGAFLLVVVAGCSTSEQGSPIASGGSETRTSAPPTSKTTKPTTTSKAPVNRPKSIDLTATDGCKIMNGIPAADFGIQGRKLELEQSLVFKNAMDCVVVAPDAALAMSFTTVTTIDAQDFAAGARGEVTSITVAGFPAFTVTVPSAVASCFLGVNVSDGQMFYLQWRYNKSANIPPPAQLCENAKRAAAAGMKVLGAS